MHARQAENLVFFPEGPLTGGAVFEVQRAERGDPRAALNRHQLVKQRGTICHFESFIQSSKHRALGEVAEKQIAGRELERLVACGARVCVASVSPGNVTRATKPIPADQAGDYTACV